MFAFGRTVAASRKDGGRFPPRNSMFSILLLQPRFLFRYYQHASIQQPIASRCHDSPVANLLLLRYELKSHPGCELQWGKLRNVLRIV